MKKLIIVALSIVIIMGIGIGNALAENSLIAKKTGISVGFVDTGDSVIDITGKYLITDDIALLAGFGLETHSGDADGSYFGLSLGVRKYLDTEDFALFIDGKVSYARQDVVGDTDTIDISGSFGAEYFLHEQFSVEASVGISCGVEDNNVTNEDDVYFGTRTIGVKASFYF
jgi:hypothetical protein